MCIGAFAALPSDLGNYLEIGVGLYTQTNNILNVRNDVHIANIYLPKPKIFRYLSLGDCVYKDGTIHGQRVNLLSLPVEKLPAHKFFDTVVAINVIERVFSAIDFLTAMYSAVKPGGILVFGYVTSNTRTKTRWCWAPHFFILSALNGYFCSIFCGYLMSYT